MSTSLFYKYKAASPRQKMAALFAAGLCLLLMAHPALFARQAVFGFIWGGCLLVVGAYMLLGRDRRPYPPLALWGPAAFLLGSAALSLAVQTAPDWAAMELLGVQLACCLAGWWLAADRSALPILGYGLVAGAAGAALYGLAQFFQLDPLPLATPFSDRVVSVFTNPNHFGSFMALALPLAVAFYLQDLMRWRLLAGLAVTLIYAGLLLSGSRGAWAGGVAGVVVVAVGCGVRSPRGVWAYLLRPVLGLVVVLGLTTWGLTYKPVIQSPERTVTMKERALSAKNMIGAGVQQDASINHRYFIWRVSWNMVRAAPLLGLGYGQYQRHFAAFRDALTQQPRFASLNLGQQEEITPYAHNEYLHWWAETGVLGLLGFLGMVLVGLVRGVKGTWQSKDYTAWKWGGLGLLVAVLVHSLVSYPLRLPLNSVPFWLILGALHQES